MDTFDICVRGESLTGFQAMSFQTIVDIFFKGLFTLGDRIEDGFSLVNGNGESVGWVKKSATV